MDMETDKHHINITETNGKLMVPSVMVAVHFKKKHDNIIRIIKSLEIPQDFRLINFEECSYINEQNKIQPTPTINMTRDGFVLLVIGLIGKKAMALKLKDIDEINAIERAQKEKLYLKAALQVPIDSDLTVLLPTGEFSISSWKLAREIGQSHDALTTKIHYCNSIEISILGTIKSARRALSAYSSSIQGREFYSNWPCGGARSRG